METMKDLLFYIWAVKQFKASNMHFHSVKKAEENRDDAAKQVRARVFRAAWRELRAWRKP
jgi:hypothetical protein